MVEQEKPDFFSCDCSEGHYCIEVTDRMRKRAQNLSDIDNQTDNTDSCLIPPDKQESQFKKLAEIVVYDLLSEMGVSTTCTYQSWEYDVSVNEKEAAVKVRDYAQTDSEDADLVVHEGEDKTYSPDDVEVIIQVMLNGLDSNKAYVTGYCSESERADAPVVQEEQTRRFPHEELHSLEELV